jgi:hypothetical protein
MAASNYAAARVVSPGDKLSALPNLIAQISYLRFPEDLRFEM